MRLVTPQTFLFKSDFVAYAILQARAAKEAEAKLAQQRLRLAQEQLLKEEAYKKIVVILSRAELREQNMRYQRFRLAWAHFKAQAEVRVYMRRPANRLWDRQREQQRMQRKKPT